MNPHDTPSTDALRSRRQMIAATAGLLGVGAVGLSRVRLPADITPAQEQPVVEPLIHAADAFSQPADALLPAQRGLTPRVAEGLLTFPVDVSDPERDGELVMAQGFRAGDHKGIDLGNSCTDGTGRPLLAAADGFVSTVRTHFKAGKLITLRSVDDVYFRYHHLDSFVPGLEAGDPVTAGQVVGYMGATGNTVWPHLHFEVWLNSLSASTGSPIDPMPLLPQPAGLTIGQTSC